MKKTESFPYILNAGKQRDNLRPVCAYKSKEDAMVGAVAAVIDRADFGVPAYKLSCDKDGWYKEGCFEGLA